MKFAGGGRISGKGVSWAREVVVTVIVEEFPEVGFGLKVAVAAAGRPVTVKVKVSVKPEFRAILTVKLVLAPAETVCEEGVVDRLKGGGTVKLVALVAVPSSVVTVMGPVVTAAGTVVVTIPEEFTVNVAAAPLNETAVAPVKFVPVIVTAVPT